MAGGEIVTLPVTSANRLRLRRPPATLRRMGYLIGTDEAGYGPNLGPLVISATVWEAPDGVGGEDLFARLAHVIASRPGVVGTRRVPVAGRDGRTGALPDRHTACADYIADRRLEDALLARAGAAAPGARAVGGAGTARPPPAKLARRVAGRRPGSPRPMQAVPWYADYDGPAPLDCDGEDLALLAEPLRAGLAAAGVRLLAVRSRAIFAHQFNDLVERHGSKGAALSHQTLDLAAK